MPKAGAIAQGHRRCCCGLGLLQTHLQALHAACLKVSREGLAQCAPLNIAAYAFNRLLWNTSSRAAPLTLLEGLSVLICSSDGIC